MLTLKRLIKLFYILLVLLLLIFLFSRGQIYKKNELDYGLTFSKKQAEALGLDWKKTYLSIMDDLGAKKIRVPAYWDEVEPSDNNYHWQDLDWQIEQANQRGVELIVAIGGRLPRWPECHYPDWTNDMQKDQRDRKILTYIGKTITRYKSQNNIIAWQIENEPFLSHFGNCPDLDKNLLDAEISLARDFDTRPIIVTDSGELSFWVSAAKRADIFGTTMYFDTYSKVLKRYIHYPIEPGFFRFKKNVAKLFARPNDWIVIELQAEPWGAISYQKQTQEERNKTMSIEKFRYDMDFAAKTGFKEFYLWGAEWWYWEKENNNNPIFWNEAKTLFNK